MPTRKSRFDTFVRCCSGLGLAIGLGGCTPAPPPSAPAPAVSAPPAASAAPSALPAPTSPPAPSASTPPPSETPPPTVEKKPSEEPPPPKPIAILTAKEVAFMVDYANSDAKARAVTSCDQEAKGDPEARAACLDKARQKFLPDVLRFDQNKQKQWSLIIYKRDQETLKEVYIGRVTFADETQDSVRLRVGKPESGQRPIFRSGTSVIKVPNAYSLELEDPQLGKLTYQAKIGLVPPR